MSKPRNPNNKELAPVFMASQATDGATVLIVGLSEAAMADMIANPDMAKDIDLRKVGIPLVLQLMGGSDRDAVKQTILGIAKQLGIAVLDESRRDFGIAAETPKANS